MSTTANDGCRCAGCCRWNPDDEKHPCLDGVEFDVPHNGHPSCFIGMGEYIAAQCEVRSRIQQFAREHRGFYDGFSPEEVYLIAEDAAVRTYLSGEKLITELGIHLAGQLVSVGAAKMPSSGKMTGAPTVGRILRRRGAK